MRNAGATAIERSWAKYTVPVRYGYGYRNAGARYPGISSAWSGDAMSLWWQTTDAAGVTRLCATQGKTLVKQLQQQLQTVGPGLTVDGNFGPDTLSALIEFLSSQLHADPSTIGAVQADMDRLTDQGATRPAMRGTPVSFSTQQAAIWAATASDLPLSGVNVPRTIITLRFAQPAPDDGGSAGDITCVPMSEISSGSTAATGSAASGGAAAPTGTPASGTSPLVFVAGFGLLALLATGKKRKG